MWTGDYGKELLLNGMAFVRSEQTNKRKSKRENKPRIIRTIYTKMMPNIILFRYNCPLSRRRRRHVYEENAFNHCSIPTISNVLHKIVLRRCDQCNKFLCVCFICIGFILVLQITQIRFFKDWTLLWCDCQDIFIYCLFSCFNCRYFEYIFVFFFLHIYKEEITFSL